MKLHISSLKYGWLLLLLSVVALRCQKEETPEQQSLDETIIPDTMVFIGNDLTIANQIKPTEGFVSLFKQRCKKVNFPIKVVNAGIRGEPLPLTTERLPFILAHEIEWLVLESTESFPAAFLQHILDRQPQVNIVLLITQNDSNHYRKELANRFSSFKKQLLLIEIPSTPEGEILQRHQQIATEVFRLIQKYY